MKESKGGRAKSTKMATVQCSICGMDMDCPESMLSADRHFCARCTDLLAEGYEPEELKMDKKSLAHTKSNFLKKAQNPKASL
jgi:transcription elongation factor Elf1